MLKTHLSFDYSTNLNPKIIRLYDISHYCNDETIDNMLIEVLPVNSNKWVVFHINKQFSLALNSSNLGYSVVSNTRDLIDLHDGIYEIKFSVKPNSSTVIHRYHFRVVSLLMKLKAERAKLINNECKLSREEFRENRDKLREIEEYIDAAVYMVEENGDKSKGKEIYKWAEKLLEQYTNDCKC